MSNVLRLALVDPNKATRDVVKSTVMDLSTVWLEAECSRYEFFVDAVKQAAPDVGVICLDDDPQQGLAIISELGEVAPNVSILVASSSTDGNLILQAMRAGAKEFLTQPVKPEDFTAALKRISRQRFGDTASTTRSCTTIAVTGATGGVGGTSVAVNIGCALAANEKNSVVLVDLDLALGDADVLLDTIPEYTLTDVAQNISRLDLTLLKQFFTKHSSGIHFLPRPVNLDGGHHVKPDDLRRITGLLKASFTHLIFDTSKSFSDVDRVAIESADEILMVTQLELPSLRNVIRVMQSFEDTWQLDDSLKIVVNRLGQNSGQISLKKAQDTLGQDVYWRIPNDDRVMTEVRNQGVPLVEYAPRAAITQSINQLALAVGGGEDSLAVDDTRKSRSWLSLWPKATKIQPESQAG
jgi:pilus assembly protein CpaE